MNIDKKKLLRDAIGDPVYGQYWNGEKFVVDNTNGIDFRKVKMLRDATGSVIPQYWDGAKFVPNTSSGGGGEPGDDGKSAYELAIENGFVGTEEEWLESLKGEPGPPGQDADVTAVTERVDNLETEVNEHLKQTMVDGVHGLATTQDMTLYVSNDGDDNNDGLTLATSLKTIQKAIDKIPKIVDHTITVNISPGTYNESIKAEGFIGGKGSISIVGNTTLASTHNMNSIQVNRVDVPFVIRGFNFNVGTSTNIWSRYSKFISIQYCRAIVTSSLDAILIESSNSRIYGCELSNHAGGIHARDNANVNSDSNIGSGNNVGLATNSASRIGKIGSQPSGTSAEFEGAGCIIK